MIYLLLSWFDDTISVAYHGISIYILYPVFSPLPAGCSWAYINIFKILERSGYDQHLYKAIPYLEELQMAGVTDPDINYHLCTGTWPGYRPGGLVAVPRSYLATCNKYRGLRKQNCTYAAKHGSSIGYSGVLEEIWNHRDPVELYITRTLTALSQAEQQGALTDNLILKGAEVALRGSRNKKLAREKLGSFKDLDKITERYIDLLRQRGSPLGYQYDDYSYSGLKAERTSDWLKAHENNHADIDIYKRILRCIRYAILF